MIARAMPLVIAPAQRTVFLLIFRLSEAGKMRPMQRRLCILLTILILAALACNLGAPPPAPGDGLDGEALFDGVAYTRTVRTAPRPMVIHVVTVDLRTKGIGIFVTPGDPDRDLPLDARTTSQFLDEFGLQLAVNGDGFTPWDANPLNPYPKPGEPVDPLGLAVSNGVQYSEPRDAAPVLYFTPASKARFNDPPANVAHAISGLEMLVTNGEIVPGLNEGAGAQPEPRTALGLNRAGHTLILVVVDGRQPGYSEGATLPELAAILLEYGAHNAMNMDGGGSSTLVMEGADGQPVVLNSPIAGNVPGRERAVANHLGIFAKKK